MDTDKTKYEAGANADGNGTSGPVLGSARGLFTMQPGRDQPMGSGEVEAIFFPCDAEAESSNRQ